MPDRSINRDELIAGISDALCFDSGLFWAARKALTDAGDEELVDLFAATSSLRQRLTQQVDILRTKNSELFSEIEVWNRENQYQDTKSLRDLSLELQVEQGPIFRLVNIIRKEHAALRRGTLDGEIRLGIYISMADAIFRAASKAISKRIDLDEKIDLAELAAESLVGINEIAVKHDAKPLEGMIYNCLQACIKVDALGGFDGNVDKFSSVTVDELKRIGPQLLDYVQSVEFEQRYQQTSANSIEATDLLLNSADVLKLWAGIADPRISDGVFEKCFELYERALDFASGYKPRAPLIVSRYSDAYLRIARLKFEYEGVAGRDEILSNCRKGIRLLSRITSADGDLRPDKFNIIPLKFKELQFAMLAMEIDPTIRGLKSYAVSAIFELAGYGNRLRTAQPWVFFHRIFSEIYNEVEEGISILTHFIENTHSPMAKMRASFTRARLEGNYYAIPELPDDPAWLDGLRSHPTSVFRFKGALKEYNNEGFGPKGTQPPLVLDSNFPNVGYAKLFAHLVTRDKLLQERVLDQVYDAGILEESGLLAFFQDLFGKEQSAGLEELSKFLLQRGKSRLYQTDIFACVELLRNGISYSDDAYWYGRLVDAYRHVKELNLAEDTAAAAKAKFPNDSQIAVQAALVQVAKGDFAGAATVISKFVAEFGSELSSFHPAVQGIYAYSMMRSDQGHIAEGIYRDMVATRPGDWRASHGLGCLLYRRGREWYLEALRVWTSTVLIRNKVDDIFQDWIARDCILNIAQTAKELNVSEFEGKGELSTYLNEIGERLPTTRLIGLMNGMMVCGGLKGQVLCLAEHVSGRRDDRLSKAFIQCCMSMLVEDVIKQRETPYAARVIDFALKHHVLGDLFGGAKGAYTRNLLRISATPIVERNFNVRWNQIKDTQLSGEWSTLAKCVSQSGYIPNYYVDVYETIQFTHRKEHAEIEEMLYQIIYRVANALKGQVDRKKILLDESYPRSFSVNYEDAVSEDLDRQIYNCDPDKLRALLQHFQKVGMQTCEESTSWELAGEIDNELQHALMTSNIRTEVIRSDAFIASVDSAASMFS